jgi:thiol-disulfide isomerase/thioredoxin
MSLSNRRMLAVIVSVGFSVSLAAFSGCDGVDAPSKAKAPAQASISGEQNADQNPASSGDAAGSSPSKLAAKDNVDAAEAGALKSRDVTLRTTLPDNSDELIAYLRRLDAVRLEEDTREARARFTAVQKAIIEAADKLLDQKGLDEKVRLEAIQTKWGATLLLVQLDDQGAEERFLALVNKLVEDKNPDVSRAARWQLRQLDVTQNLRALMQGKLKNTEKLMQDLNLILADDRLAYPHYNLLETAARILESREKFDEAAKIYAGMEKAFQAADDPELAAQAAFRAQQAAKRLGWIGKEVELAGVRLDGTPFDVEELKGKVVLIDFWATWCGPCIEELPNVVENYKKYHDRGFEIVGVSLDVDKDALDRFVKGENDLKRKLEWITLFWSDATATAEADPYENPLAKKFGVDGVPSTFLVDQDGKVVSLGVRGERLGEKLAELLGTPDDVPEEQPQPAAAAPETQ